MPAVKASRVHLTSFTLQTAMSFKVLQGRARNDVSTVIRDKSVQHEVQRNVPRVLERTDTHGMTFSRGGKTDTRTPAAFFQSLT